MNCDKCGAAMQRQENGYSCPGCGAIVSDPPRQTTIANRLAGVLLAAIGIALAVLFFVQSSRYTLVLFNFELPLGMPCLGIGSVLLALFGLALALGLFDVGSRRR